MTALEYFRQFAPAFNNLPDDVVSGWLSSAQLFTGTPTTPKSVLMQALYAAHLCWIKKNETGLLHGSVKSEKDGTNERTYNELTESNNFLGQSTYGMQYMQLRGSSSKAAIITRFGL